MTLKLIPLVDLQAQYRAIKAEIDVALERVISRGSFILGEEVAAFEEAFAEYCGARHAIGVASGTAALHLALLACDVGPGDEVITSPHTFIATVEAIVHAGARPILVDIDPQTYNLDAARVEDAITARTRAIVPVHLYGRPAPMREIGEIARRRGLRLVEDACQAHGASYGGRRAGALGDAGVFSFYPGKNLGAFGDGGMVVTDNPDCAARIRALRDHGRSEKYIHATLGYGERLDALQAAVLAVKLGHLERWNERRRTAAARYRQLLGDQPLVLPAADGKDLTSVYHLFVVRVRRRDAVLSALKAAGIGVGVHYPLPVHLQPAFAHLNHQRGAFPFAEQAAEEVLSLPLYPEIAVEQLQEVVDVLSAALQSSTGRRAANP